MSFQDILVTVFSSVGVLGLVAIGIWVGTIQTKVQILDTKDDKIDGLFTQIQNTLRELSDRISRIEGKLGL
jgi:hypothetical protein